MLLYVWWQKMKKNKKKIYIIGIICLILLVILLVINFKQEKSYLKEIKYDKVIEKINNKESFVLLLSQTTCSHCIAYKPTVEKVSKEYKLTIYYLETNLMNKKEAENFKKYISYSGTPTTVFIINGEEKTVANRLNGAVEESKLIEKLKSNGFIK